MGNTTKYFAQHSGVMQNPSTRYAHHSGSWQAIMGRWARHSGVWQLTYSTPSVSCANVTGSASGGGSSGSVTSNPAAPSTGGYNSGSFSYAWSQVGGPGMVCSNLSIANPTFSATVPNGTPAASSWQITVTDTVTGATASVITTVTLTWSQTFSPFNQTFTSGSGSVTVPTGAANLTIILVGGGGMGGGASFNIPSGNYAGGGGGGSGGYSSSSTSVTSGDWGATVNYAVGQAGQNISGTNGSGSSVSGHYVHSVGGGSVGGTASYPTMGTGGAAGSPGGNAGATGSLNTGGSGGAAPYSTYGRGSDGGSSGFAPGNGTDGVVIFQWT